MTSLVVACGAHDDRPVLEPDGGDEPSAGGHAGKGSGDAAHTGSGGNASGTGGVANGSGGVANGSGGAGDAYGYGGTAVYTDGGAGDDGGAIAVLAAPSRGSAIALSDDEQSGQDGSRAARGVPPLDRRRQTRSGVTLPSRRPGRLPLPRIITAQ
jgi:hypothetical protein